MKRLLVMGRFDQHADYYRCTTMRYLAALLVMVTFCGCGGGETPQQTDGSIAETPSDVPKPNGKELQTLKGHTHWVRSVAFSPDGQRIVSCSTDKTVKIWDANTGKGLHTLKGHDGSVNSVAFSPDGQRVVSGSRDKTVKIWDASSGKELHTLKGHTDYVRSVAFSPDGQRIVSGCGGSDVPKELRTLSGSSDNTLKIWDASSGKELHTLKGHDDEVMSVAFSPDGQRVVSGSHDKTLKIWDASEEAE